MEDRGGYARFKRDWDESIQAVREQKAWRTAHTCPHCGHCPPEPHYSVFRSRARSALSRVSPQQEDAGQAGIAKVEG